jgi:hypothetical protein
MMPSGVSSYPEQWRPEFVTPDPAIIRTPEQLEASLLAEPYTAHLAAALLDSPDRNLPDFFWLYHGKVNSVDSPEVIRDGIRYDHVITSMFTDSGHLVHARESIRADLAVDDPRRYFVVTLDLNVPRTTEWRIIKVTTEPVGNGYGGIVRDVYLADRPLLLPAGPSGEALTLPQSVLARKRAAAQLEEAYARLPRLRILPERTQLIHDGLIEPSRASMAALSSSVMRIFYMTKDVDSVSSQPLPKKPQIQHLPAATIA